MNKNAKRLVSLMLAALLCVLCMPMTVLADEVNTATFMEETITFSSGTAVSWSDTEGSGNLILEFPYSGSESSKEYDLTIPTDMNAWITVVGGGASGATGKKGNGTSLAYQGDGGGGGKVIDTGKDFILPAGNYTITVGAGGSPVLANNSSNATPGKEGHASAITGSFGTLMAEGGTPGIGCGTPKSTNTEAVDPMDGFGGGDYPSDITGTIITYGKNGTKSENAAKAGVSGTKPGEGGQGGGRTGYVSGAGAGGTVIVRLWGVCSENALLTKTAEWKKEAENEEAELKITSEYTFEREEDSLDILFLGGLCDAHSLDQDVVKDSLNLCSEYGDVDYYLGYPKLTVVFENNIFLPRNTNRWFSETSTTRKFILLAI